MDKQRVSELVAILNTNAQQVYHLIRNSGNQELLQACGPLLLGRASDATAYGIWDVADELEEAFFDLEHDDEEEEDDEWEDDGAEAAVAVAVEA